MTGTRSALLVPGEPTSITVHRLTAGVPIWAADGTAGTRAMLIVTKPVAADSAGMIFFISAASVRGQRSNTFYSLRPPGESDTHDRVVGAGIRRAG